MSCTVSSAANRNAMRDLRSLEASSPRHSPVFQLLEPTLQMELVVVAR
jgi:hypothetical protein